MGSLEIRRLLSSGFKKFYRYSSTGAIKSISNGSKQGRTVDLEDVKQHEKMSDKWWNVDGGVRALHSMNPLRVQLIRDGLANGGWKQVNPGHPLEGIKILDVGCGGGILSEPLARIGANVTGIDASSELISTAKKHAALDPSLSGRITYLATSIEDHVNANPFIYDAVVASEIIEHVTDPELFLKSCSESLKPGGSIFITTLNKTLPSWIGGIVLAEYLLKIIPQGTHDWNKFIAPKETQRLLEKCGCKTKLIHGMFYNPLKNEWSWSSSTSIFYAIHAMKI